MKKKGKILAVVLCGLWAYGGIPAYAADHERQDLDRYELDEMIVEGRRENLPGNFIAAKDRVGLLGETDILDVPFTQNRYTFKTLEVFENPNQPLNGVLGNNPSVRIASNSTMYTDFKMRGITMNANHYVLNGIPSLFNQSLNLPMYTIENVELVSGPNTVLNGATNSTNGTNGTDAAPGILYATTKKAPEADLNRYKQVFSGKGNWAEIVEFGRRFGGKKEWGVRVMARHQDGETAITSAKSQDKSVYINIDHQDKRSTTNIFGGYFDGGTIGGQRWFQSSSLTHMLSAPDLSRNFSFPGQRKMYNGYLLTLNNEQKLNENWSAFFSAGGNKYQEEKYDPMGGSPDLADDGTFSKKMRHYKSRISSFYLQGGVRGKIQTGEVTNNFVLSVDREQYKSYANNVAGGVYRGNLRSGVISVGAWPRDINVYAGSAINEVVTSLVLADNIKYRKWSAYLAGQFRSSKYKTRTQDISKNSFNPTYALAYKPTENLSIYASYATSYTRPFQVSGGYVNDGEVFAPIKNQQAEFGVKYKTGKFLHALAYFDLRQASYMRKAVAGGDQYTQDGKNHFKGMEWIFTGEVSEKWNLLGGVTYIHDERTSTVNHAMDGWRVIGTPRWNAVLAAEYSPETNTALIGRIRFTDRQLANDRGVTSPSFTLFDLGIRYKTKIDMTPVTLSAMCYNVLNKNYFTADDLGEPRTFILSAQFDL